MFPCQNSKKTNFKLVQCNKKKKHFIYVYYNVIFIFAKKYIKQYKLLLKMLF